MLSKVIFYSIIVILVVLLFSLMALSKRRELPFQEIVPLDDGIAVINAEKWYNNDIQITLFSEDTKPKNKNYNKAGVCLFQKLSNKKKYTVEIKRTDLKGKLLYKKFKKNVSPKIDGVKYVVLVGASVGKDWCFPELPNRLDLGEEIIFGNRTVYNFDKSNIIDELINLPITVYAVIIKECSAYFPRDIVSSKKQIYIWVKQLQQNNILPVLATVATVTKAHDSSHPGRFDSILAYNDFIRSFAYREGIEVLDLEEALRISGKERHLKDEYSQPDGNHLVIKAYDEALDKIVLPLINNLKVNDIKG